MASGPEHSFWSERAGRRSNHLVDPVQDGGKGKGWHAEDSWWQCSVSPGQAEDSKTVFVHGWLYNERHSLTLQTWATGRSAFRKYAVRSC